LKSAGELLRVSRDRVDLREPLCRLELRSDEVVDLLDRILAALRRREHRLAVLGLRRGRDVAEGDPELLFGICSGVFGRAVGVVEGPRMSLVVGTAARGCQEPAGDSCESRESCDFRLHGDRGYRSTGRRVSGIMGS
jgi:hypothetical protein